ncbi:MAG: GGDEF domain-containing protein [Eubacteriaceae bacterium]|nr:GGDEF domain-containing protein [Eubacteriaceae bacterium]
MKITKKIFNDLAIYMICFGVLIGSVFPFFCIILGVPKEIVLTPVYFISCILAGIILGSVNIFLARKTVGSRIKQLSQKMKHVENILINKKNGIRGEECTPDNCLIKFDSEDELGESADSFNSLILTLTELLETHNEIQLFSEMLTSHLELEMLSHEALNHLVKNTNSNGGAILIEKSGELIVEAIDAIKDGAALENNERILKTMKTLERQLIKFPDEVKMDGILVDFHPKELLIEPIVYKNILLGVIILVSTSSFSSSALNKLSIFSQEISLAFRNAITHNQMQLLAALDALTGLYNRRFGALRIQEEFSRAIRANTPLSILIFDIDHFKNVNDTYGHIVGDKVLVSIAKIALASIREGDVLVRYGGEEFLCVLPGANQSDANIIAERIRIIVMNNIVKHAEQDIRVTISIGVASYPHNNIADSDQLIKLADDAMYVAKNTGRNRTVLY